MAETKTKTKTKPTGASVDAYLASLASPEQLARPADVVLSSDAPRAVASARLLAQGREVIISPLLRELELRAPDLGPVRLPLLAWAFAVGGRALFLSLRGQYPSAAEIDRVDKAAQWLQELALQHTLVLAVTHASFRRRLGGRLVLEGWQPESRRRTLRHWSAWLFRAAS